MSVERREKYTEVNNFIKAISLKDLLSICIDIFYDSTTECHMSNSKNKIAMDDGLFLQLIITNEKHVKTKDWIEFSITKDVIEKYVKINAGISEKDSRTVISSRPINQGTESYTKVDTILNILIDCIEHRVNIKNSYTQEQLIDEIVNNNYVVPDHIKRGSAIGLLDFDTYNESMNIILKDLKKMGLVKKIQL